MDPILPGYRLEAPLGGDPDSAEPDESSPATARSDLAPETHFEAVGMPTGDRRPATVWRAVRIADGTAVAVKVFAVDHAALARREAALLAAVDHPHVLALLDVVSGPGHVGLVTELAAGGSLREVLRRRGRLPWQEGLTVLIPLADALSAADERGVVHGDLSTGNVLFDEVGRPLLADLGAARASAELSEPVAVTPTDVAPEVARGAVPDRLSDLFSLGSIALQCLSGRPAWPADDLTDVLIQSTAGQWPDPDDVIAPEPLLDIVRRLLDPDPGRRGSAAAAAVDLRRVGDPAPVDLAGLGADGQPRVAATVVRPDVAALRRADLTASPPRRRLRVPRPPFTGRRTSAGSAGAPRHRPGTHRKPAPSAGRPAWLPRVRGALIATAVVLALGVAAVRVGLWWAGSGRVDPASVSAVPPAAPTEGPGGVAGATTSGAAPAVSDANAADPVDWAAVVSGLDAMRAQALTARDPALLDLVYTPDSPARSADARTIRELAAAGYRLIDARHQIGTVTQLADRSATTGPGPPSGGVGSRTAVAVVESLPAIDISDDSGLVVGHTGPSGPATVVLLVVATDAGFRISSIRSG